jgi:hypothetical protein
MPPSLRLPISLRQAKVNNVQGLIEGAFVDQKVVRLDVTMDKAAIVYIFNSVQHLNSQLKRCF